MKYDINLLHKRKTKKYSGRKWAAILIGIAFFAGGLYAGITLPSEALSAANMNSLALNNQVIEMNVAKTQHDEKMIEYNEKLQHRDDLETIDSTKSEVYAYLQTIEDALPTDANITNISISGNKLEIYGLAKNDSVVAMFVVKLREKNTFEHIYIETSAIIAENNLTGFKMLAQLPSNIDGFQNLQNELEEQQAQQELGQENLVDELTDEYTDQTQPTQEEGT